MEEYQPPREIPMLYQGRGTEEAEKTTKEKEKNKLSMTHSGQEEVTDNRRRERKPTQSTSTRAEPGTRHRRQRATPQEKGTSGRTTTSGNNGRPRFVRNHNIRNIDSTPNSGTRQSRKNSNRDWEASRKEQEETNDQDTADYIQPGTEQEKHQKQHQGRGTEYKEQQSQKEENKATNRWRKRR